MEVLKRVMTTTTTACPLKDDGEGGVCLRNVDDGLDGLDSSLA